MDDMNAFERQVAGRIERLVGPARPVDDAAIFTAVTATRSSRWRFRSLFSATKLVVAAAVVALFGAFLLAGVLTQPTQMVPGAASPSSTRIEQLLSSMITEEVEPGVVRVINDGVMDLSRPVPDDFEGWGFGILAGLDGSAWVRELDTFRRLGGEQVYSAGADGGPQFFELARVDPDGTLWVTGGDGADGYAVWSLDTMSPEGTAWQRWDFDANTIKLDDMGGFWELSEGSGAVRMSRTTADGSELEAVEVPWPYASFPIVSITDDGEIWAWSNDERFILRFDGEAWTTHPTPDALRVPVASVGGDGTAWMYLSDGTLARFDGTDWAVFDAYESVRLLNDPDPFPSIAGWQVAPDGSFWETDHECHGLRRFDGTAWTTYLQGHCIGAFTTKWDGAVWVTGHEDPATNEPLESPADKLNLYFITPAATRTSE